MKKLFLGIVIGMGLLLAFGYFFRNLFDFRSEPVIRQESEVLLEKVKSVAKLVTVEGYFSEVFDHKQYYWADIAMFRKKALIKVKAKVSVGYDLEKTVFEIQPTKKKLIISNLPDPEIISIDTDISYYDLTEGTFNNFTAGELTNLNQKAKEMIEQKAKESDLLLNAEGQAQKILDLIKLIAADSGYEIEYAVNIPGMENPGKDTLKN